MNGDRAAGWIVDASVAVKWFLGEGLESDSDLAREAIGRLSMKTSTLAFYEVGNTIGRAPAAGANAVNDSLNAMLNILGPPVNLEPPDFVLGSELARKHGITFYDASYSAIAQRLNRGVISADRDLLEPGLAVSLREAMGL
jgi:predicted nucleic acid-binding protein